MMTNERLKSLEQLKKLQDEIDCLKCQKCDTIDLVDAVNAMVKNMQEQQLLIMKEAVAAVHHHSICINSKGFYQTRYDAKGNRFRSKTEYGLYLKLYEYYFGETLDKGSTKLSRIFEKYADFRLHEDICEECTAMQDRQVWNKYLKGSVLADMGIASVKPKHILAEYRRILREYQVTRRQLGKVKYLINGMFRYAIQELEIIETNPAREVDISNFKYAVEKDHSRDVFSEEEKEAIESELEKMDGIYALAVRFAFCFTLRIGELCALTWDDYDEKDEMLYVHHQMVVRNHTCVDVPYTKSHKKSGERYLPVSQKARDILEQAKQISGNGKYIFPNTKGVNPISTAVFNDTLKKACKQAGIPYRSSHKIRFYGVTSLYERNVPEYAIQYSAGHSTAEMTRHYRRISYTPAKLKELLL